MKFATRTATRHIILKFLSTQTHHPSLKLRNQFRIKRAPCAPRHYAFRIIIIIIYVCRVCFSFISRSCRLVGSQLNYSASTVDRVRCVHTFRPMGLHIRSKGSWRTWAHGNKCTASHINYDLHYLVVGA